MRHRIALDLLGPDGPLRVPMPDTDVLADDPIDPTPCVGDWVLVSDQHVVACLPRRTRLVRKTVGRSSRPQVVAANLDRVFLVTSMNADFSPRRIERYLVAVVAGGVQPVVVLTKADLRLAEARRFVAQVEAVAIDVPVVVTSALLDMGIDDLRELLQPGLTVGFVGSSGTGKSTLVNALMGQEYMHVEHIRERDQTGQHTTTHRELIPLPDGQGLLLDTPGMREFQPYGGEALDTVFADLQALSHQCRFRDCGHGQEPGCAIQAAIETGELDAARLASWQKLQRETARLEGSKSAWAAKEDRRKWGRVVRDAVARKKAVKPW